MDARSKRRAQDHSNRTVEQPRDAPGRVSRDTTPAPGKAAERLAQRHLEARGLKVLAANYRCRYGELDLVMQDGAALVVVEVKARRSDRYGAPEAFVTVRKIRCLTRAARSFVHDYPQFSGMMLRFDVVGILTRGARPRIRWIRDALQFDGR